MTLSPRLVAAGAIRRMALHDASDDASSRVLLAELSGLLRAYYIRSEQPPVEQVARVGASDLVAWWTVNADSLAPLHRDLASGFLMGTGVSVQ